MNVRHLPSKDVLRWLALGLALREAFSFWTGHPFDMEIWVRNAYYVSHGWNPYQLLPPAPGLSFTYVDQLMPSVSYLPLWPLLLGAIYDVYSVLPFGGRFTLYFLLKQPPILGDVALGYLLYVAVIRWGGDRAVARKALAFWMVFPYAIFISAVWGMFDGLVMAAVVVSLLASTSRSRAGLLGLAILLKSLPIVFVPTYILRSRGRDRWIQLLSLAVPAGFSAAVLAVLRWPLEGFSGTMNADVPGFPRGLGFGGLVGSPLMASFVPVLWDALIVASYAWVPCVLLAAIWIARRHPGMGAREEVQALLFVTTVLFLTRWVVNEQYLIYLFALLLLDLVLWHPERRGLFWVTMVLGGLYAILNNFLLVRFLVPVYPDALAVESALSSSSFGLARSVGILVLACAFIVHLVQLALVVGDDRRSARPWLFGLAKPIGHLLSSRSVRARSEP